MVTLTKGVYQALTYFCWLVEDLNRRPTRLYKQVTFQPTLDGYHDTYRYMSGGRVLSVSTTVPQTLHPNPSAAKTTPDPTGAHPIV